ncbi:MAG: RHS repeat-associated core domain-containing protein [Candidatus Margulisiibacteriota bacterium]
MKQLVVTPPLFYLLKKMGFTGCVTINTIGYWFGTQKNDENHTDFVYDKNGNRTAKQLKTPKNELLLDITYAWNAQNRMTRYTLNGTTQTNRYQFSGPRYEKKETSPEGTETTRFYPDDSLRLLSEKITDAKGQKSYAYVYLGTQKLARISKNLTTQKDEIAYFLNDALGTPAWITYEHTASPNAPVLISQNLRDPWGNEMGSTLFNQTPVRDFTGKQLDTLSNLYDFGFRYYDSLLGTWIGKDLAPVDYEHPLTISSYIYCVNNPVNFIDPDGLTFLSNMSFLWDWMSGSGDRTRDYGPEDIETKEMAESPGAEAMREKFYKNGAQSSKEDFSYETGKAAIDTLVKPSTADWGGTGAQVGGFRGQYVNNGDGTVTYTIKNEAGTHSFFYHMLPNLPFKTGPMSTITQTFRWTEPIKKGYSR